LPPLRVALLGSTGSIGVQTLEVCAEDPHRVEVVALAAGTDLAGVLSQAERHGVPHVAVAREPSTPVQPPAGMSLTFGDEAILELIDRSAPDLIINAIVGGAGLPASRRALELGIPLALANKESIVIAGELLTGLARKTGTPLIPIDSEHSALLQCLRAGSRGEVRKLVLTASGGPFRGRDRGALAEVTPEEALRHPTWSMGSRISIDSATLMNKGLEVIEAHHLFEVDVDRIEVVVHPQSVVHSMVEFQDGSWLAHLGPADMKIPIRYALGHPARWEGPPSNFSLAGIGRLDFEEPDHETFPSLQFAYEACRRGGTLPAVFNAADEVAVEAFLAGRISLPRIFEVVERALREHEREPATDWTRLLEIDRETRERVASWTS
jgi:1-deoxy-D-xylulose-5-phosphate reductoisomerase